MVTPRSSAAGLHTASRSSTISRSDSGSAAVTFASARASTSSPLTRRLIRTTSAVACSTSSRHDLVVDAVRDVVQGQAQGRERGTELVRGVGDEDPLRGDQGVQAFRALVEGAGQGLGLRRSRHRRARGQVAVAELARHGVEFAQRRGSAGGRPGRRAPAAAASDAHGQDRPGSPRCDQNRSVSPRSGRRPGRRPHRAAPVASRRAGSRAGTVITRWVPQMKTEPQSVVGCPRSRPGVTAASAAGRGQARDRSRRRRRRLDGAVRLVGVRLGHLRQGVA